MRERYLANHYITDFQSGTDTEVLNGLLDPFYPRFWPERAREEFGAWSSGAVPKSIFVCDMSDLFGIGIPKEWTRRILNKIGMSYYREHRFYLLTKQPQNLIKFSPFPENCWVGVTATNTRMALQACLKLGDIEASVRYLSIEPMLASINLPPEHLKVCKINWVIIGACTGKKYELLELCQRWNIEGLNQGTRLMQYRGNLWTLQPNKTWISEIIDACQKANIPLFLKDNLRPLLEPRHIVVRQEMPR